MWDGTSIHWRLVSTIGEREGLGTWHSIKVVRGSVHNVAHTTQLLNGLYLETCVILVAPVARGTLVLK